MFLTYSCLGKKERKWIAAFPIALLIYSIICCKLEIYEKKWLKFLLVREPLCFIVYLVFKNRCSIYYTISKEKLKNPYLGNYISTTV